MSAFSAIEKAKPPATVVMPIAAFATSWEDRPKSDVCIGLRLVAEEDLQQSRVEAAKIANRAHPKALTHPQSAEAALWGDSYHDALRRWIVARGTCDPNDVSRAWSGWAAAPEDIVPMALTRGGLDLIFDRWEIMRVATDPTMAEATDEEFGDLAAAVEKLALIHPLRASRIRRLVRFCLDEIEAS